MKMNHFVIPALLMFGMTAACVESTPVLQLKGAAPQNPDCSFPSEGEVGLLGGSVNLGFRAGYSAVFSVTSNLVSTPIEVAEEPVSGDEDLNTIYVTELELSYESSVEIPQPEGPVLLYGTLEAGGQLLLPLLTAAADGALRGALGGAGQPSSVEVLVTVRVRGQRASGDEVESNEIVFPLTVAELNPDDIETAVCGEGKQFVAPTESCDQRGLNGVLPECEEIPEPPPAP